MDLYDELARDVEAAKRDDEVYNIHLSTVKRDLAKRKAGWYARVIILSIWAVILIGAILVTSGVLQFGGTATTGPMTGPDGEIIEAPDTNTGGEEEPEFSLELMGGVVAALFVPMTWTLCFVGFPIGWNWSKDERDKSKNQIYVQHTVYDDGTVDTYSSSLVPKISAFFFSLIQGCLTMAFSVPIAIVQCFTWKGHIKKIEGIVAEIEANPELFVCD